MQNEGRKIMHLPDLESLLHLRPGAGGPEPFHFREPAF